MNTEDKNPKSDAITMIVEHPTKILLSEFADNISYIPLESSNIAFMPEFYMKDNKNEYVGAYIDAFQLKVHVASAAFKSSTPKCPEKKKELAKLANSLKDDDNPVLMLVRLK